MSFLPFNATPLLVAPKPLPFLSHATNHASQVEPLAANTPSTADRPALTRTSKPKTRNGKIARLPHPIRDMVNRMLRNNIPHSKIVDALDEHAIKVTERNVSNWL